MAPTVHAGTESTSIQTRHVVTTIMAITLLATAGSVLFCFALYAVLGLPFDLHSLGGRVMLAAPLLTPLLLCPVAAYPAVREYNRAVQLGCDLQRTATSLADEVAQRRSMQEQLAFAAHHDELTGVLNRRGLFAQVSSLSPGNVLLLLDVDNFKKVNDSWGHAAGDRALIAVSQAIRHAIEPTLIARLGGDEFIAIVNSDADLDLRVLATQLRSIRVVVNGDHELVISASFGVVIATSYLPIDSALAMADAKMYRRKRALATSSQELTERRAASA